ncbi:hypothetical protein M0812_16433 [Anaeramoeba flamelloides]|uniref:Uncharacterized protein n=1 Tax=Anaeramoeba flamelloides TaxID=1746091 RepID=A0AAV7Z5C7_9EUKA|nr:hypothetical protein M0812_16433 [Anaeramoeba flamelloides]
MSRKQTNKKGKKKKIQKTELELYNEEYNTSNYPLNRVVHLLFTELLTTTDPKLRPASLESTQELIVSKCGKEALDAINQHFGTVSEFLFGRFPFIVKRYDRIRCAISVQRSGLSYKLFTYTKKYSQNIKQIKIENNKKKALLQRNNKNKNQNNKNNNNNNNSNKNNKKNTNTENNTSIVNKGDIHKLSHQFRTRFDKKTKPIKQIEEILYFSGSQTIDSLKQQIKNVKKPNVWCNLSEGNELQLLLSSKLLRDDFLITNMFGTIYVNLSDERRHWVRLVYQFREFTKTTTQPIKMSAVLDDVLTQQQKKLDKIKNDIIELI